MSRFHYYQRIISAYLLKRDSHLSFWHGTPKMNENISTKELGEYYMPFQYKARYQGPFDHYEIPLLDYKGKVGKQYNPIAIAQYGLGHYNLYKNTNNKRHLAIFFKQANWFIENLEKNPYGLHVWNHHFDWEYRDRLKAPWYSALSQGQGISVLARAYEESKREEYLHTAKKAFESFKHSICEGGVSYTDERGFLWFEETTVNPPTHILNGFIWALWGIYDYYLLTNNKKAEEILLKSIETLKENLKFYDIGFWSLYELSGTKLKMVASYFYHSLHIVQLRVMFKLTREKIFNDYADKWSKYKDKRFNRYLALAYKTLFKLLYY